MKLAVKMLVLLRVNELVVLWGPFLEAPGNYRAR